jgi:spore germination protein GerM
MSTGRRLVGALLGATVLVAAGCGVPDDRAPRVISAAEAPIDLDPAGDQTPSGGEAEVSLYFVREGSLVSVSRAAETETLGDALAALLAGPTEQEATVENGVQLTTRIPLETELRDVSESGEIATIILGCAADATQTPGCGVLGLEGQDQILLFGQLACTADAVPGISGVLFQQELEPLDALLPDAASTAEPVRCFDYRPLFPSTDDDDSDGSGGSGD